jgi:hypothetical protein
VELSDITPNMTLVALALLALGFGVGLLVSRLGNDWERRSRELERELEQAHQELRDHRDQVGAHFDRTSELLRTMTLQYRSLYQHLAEGAQYLGPEGAPPLGAGDPVDRLLGPISSVKPSEAAAEAKARAAAAGKAPAGAEAPSAPSAGPRQASAKAPEPARREAAAERRRPEERPKAPPPPPPA